MKAKILLLALWTLSVEAADYKVGFDQLLQAAIEHSEDLASANSQLELAKYSATYNIKSVSPQVTLSGSTTYGNSESFSTSAQSMQKNDQRNVLAKLSLLQPLYSGAVKHQKVIDQLNISAKSIAYTDAKLELMFQLFNSYINILQLHNEIASLSAEHDLLSKQLEQAEIGYAVGTVSSIDLIEIKAALATNNATVMEIKVQLDNAYLNLQQITQMEVKQIAELRSNYALPQLDLDRGLEYWQEQADKNNLALQSQRLIVSIAQKQSEFTRAKYFPTVNLSAGTQVGQNYVDGKFRDTKANSISVSVDYLLYGSGKKQADYGKSLMLMQSQQELLNKQSKSLRVKVEQQFNSLEPQQKLIEAREINVKAQLDRFRATEIGVRNGVRNQTELLAAQRSLYQSEAASKQAVYQYLIKHVSFLRSTGKLSQEALLALVNSVMSE